jgi:hypothetical protein
VNEPYIWNNVSTRRGDREPFAGLDYQGRYQTREYVQERAQQAAEAATDIGAKDDPPRPRMTPAEGLIVCVLFALSLALIASVAGILWQRWFA